ncbi:MAG: rnhA operon protein [Halobacteriales archaeon]
MDVDDDDPTGDLPVETIEAAVRLTRLARQTVDEAEATAYREDRDARLAEWGYVARVRSEETRDVLVLYPEEWITDGTVRTERIEDIDRAVERTLSGVGEENEWTAIDAHNRDLVAAVEEEAGPVHAANAAALADFMSNHYARRIETATAAELREFRTDYYPRNAWPSAEQKRKLTESIEHVFRAAGTSPPPGYDNDE